jgi:hypothetical protein
VLAKGFKLPAQPRRAPVTEAKARQFVEREAREGTTKPSSSSLRRNESGERVSVYLPPEMAKDLRVRCAKERRSVSDAVTDAVKAWLDRGAS